MSTLDSLRHWKLESASDVHSFWLDQVDDEGESTSANTLSQQVLDELDTLLDQIDAQRSRGLVIRSAKTGNFIVGADIREFSEVSSRQKVLEYLERAHSIVNRLANLPCTTLAVIDGHCLGGGCELALACDIRLALPEASFGFPEVQLGLHPGLGATVRLPALVDPSDAIPMMLTGKPKDAAAAKHIGLVNDVVEERHLDKAIEAALQGDYKEGSEGLRGRAMTSAPARRLLARQARKKTEEKAPSEHYPAPYALIDLWEDAGAESTDERLRRERESFSDLLVGETARNLIRVYFLRERLKGQGKRKGSAIRHVHVIGAGAMGGDIAAWCAYKGLRVTLEDQAAEYIAPAMKDACQLFEHKYRNEHAVRDAWDRLVPDIAGTGRARADLIVEAVPEKSDLKRDIFAEIGAVMKPDAILASNTSGILMEDLRDAMPAPERLAGLHFFNPVAKMPLVELVRHDQLGEETIARLLSFSEDIDKLPVAVASRPGFLVNRILTPYLLEAMTMLDEGYQPELVDRAAEAFGMPVGPVELADQVGLDICLGVADTLIEQLDQPLPAVPDWLRGKVDDGDLGVKTRRGFYEYKEGEAQKNALSRKPDEAMVDRLVMPFLLTAARCLEETVVEDECDLDAAVIFGTGFAPFRGGPVAYARKLGQKELAKRLQPLVDAHGERFRGSEYIWQLLATD